MNETNVTIYKNPETALSIAVSVIDSIIETDKEGNVISNDLTKSFITRDKEGTTQFSKAEALACVALGYELGLSPFISLSLGKDLTPAKIFAIDKGRSMGLSALESIKLIHTISTKGGIVIKLGVDLICRQLINAKIKFELVQDYEPVYIWQVYSKDSKSFVTIDKDRLFNGNELIDKFYLLDATVTQAEADKAKAEGKLFIQKILSDYITTWKFDRDGQPTFYSSFTKSRAVKAGLLPTINAKGEILQEGKSNWIMYEVEMMKNISLSLGTRKYAGDVLNGFINYESEFITDEVPN